MLTVPTNLAMLPQPQIGGEGARLPCNQRGRWPGSNSERNAKPFVAKAIYINSDTIATPGKLQALLDMVDRTELNSVVIDVKADNSGQVLYASPLPLVQQLNTADPIIADLDSLLAELKAKGIYTIARLPVFWDQALTGAKPEWALQSIKTPGQAWLSSNGTRWANPYSTRFGTITSA